MYETQSPVEDRFGFTAKGTFRCSRATERIAVILSLIITAIVFVSFYLIWGRQLIYIYGMHYDELKDLSESQRLGFSPVSTSHIMFFALAFTFVTVIIARLILNGVVYQYSADSNIFSFRSEKDNVRKTDIHYDDVIAVKYEERRLLRFIKRGYTVTVITRSLGNVVIEYIFNKSDKEHRPENTPFHIIEERTDIQNAKRDR